uniref:Uncharacterized protein n=1 Tax=Anabas testudineus TaxID=64144 RepID=A0A3Q1I249_ANATE
MLTSHLGPVPCAWITELRLSLLTVWKMPSTSCSLKQTLVYHVTEKPLSVCVLLFVMKMGFRQMDGDILERKCNLRGVAQNGRIVMVTAVLHPRCRWSGGISFQL